MKTRPILSTILFTLVLLGNSALKHSQSNTKQSLDTLDRATSDLVFRVPVQDTLVVKENTAVFIEPDSLKIEKRKKAIGEADFYIGADDYMYYIHLAHEYLKKQKVKIVFVKSPTKVIQFIGKDQLKTIVKLDTLSALWNVYLSTPIKKPFKIDLTDVESEYKEYFRKL